jgi:hypothetical protein
MPKTYDGALPGQLEVNWRREKFPAKFLLAANWVIDFIRRGQLEVPNEPRYCAASEVRAAVSILG